MLKKELLLILIVGFLSTIHAQQLAFPTAEGGGRFSLGGRGGTVYQVTNLNDAGAGSLRDAVSQPNRTVVFRVSGNIVLLSRLIIKQNNITIAGQTAPGDGICLSGNTLNIQASNIIIRYIRCRLGDAFPVEDDCMNSWSGNFQNNIIDHCSLSWSIDETGSFYDIRNFTLQWCILSESLYNSVHDKGLHGYAGIWGGENASFHHNLIAHHTSRTPRFNGNRYTVINFRDTVDFRNNVIYNWGNINSAYGGEGGCYNMINNYYKASPATAGSLTTSSATNKRNRIFNYTSFYYNNVDTVWGGKFYVNGNYVNGFADVTADNWTKGMQKDSYINAATLLTAAKQTNPFPVSPVQTQTAEAAYVSVLDSAGAILPCRDTVDRRVVRETRTGTATFEGPAYANFVATGISHPSGIIDKLADVGGMPIYNSTAAPLDTDADGMPDSWEIQKGLNSNNAADRNTLVNGYTNLEIYLNSITSPCATRVATTEIEKKSFSIVNNPLSNWLVIDHLNLNAAVTFSIFDLKGTQVLQQKANLSTDKTSIDISALQNGLYILNCQTTTGTTVLKFVKQ